MDMDIRRTWFWSGSELASEAVRGRAMLGTDGEVEATRLGGMCVCCCCSEVPCVVVTS
jgi:hypothetical protein